MLTPHWDSFWAYHSFDWERVQIEDVVAACAGRPARAFVDVGAHVGLWTLAMHTRFERVLAFEPCQENFNLLLMNIGRVPNVQAFNLALGDRAGEARLALAPVDGANSGQWMVSELGHSIAMKRLDDYGLKDVDLLKLDVEGYEPAVIHGAFQTIQASRPVIFLEENGMEKLHGWPARAASTFLAGMGYRVSKRYECGDLLMVSEV